MLLGVSRTEQRGAGRANNPFAVMTPIHINTVERHGPQWWDTETRWTATNGLLLYDTAEKVLEFWCDY